MIRVPLVIAVIAVISVSYSLIYIIAGSQLKFFLLTLGAHAQGLRYLVCPSCVCACVCVCVCVCVCLSAFILELRATKRHVNGTLVFSATSARKMKGTKVLTLGVNIIIIIGNMMSR